MAASWSILYRGPLASCNYACSYCPFAKRPSRRADLIEDRAALERFAGWVRERPGPLRLLLTPWGEALVHGYYQEIICGLSHLPNVDRVAIQTNLSCQLDWVTRAHPNKLALWCTFHPTQTTLARFLGQCRRLDHLGIRYSVGVVGTRDAFEFIGPLRAGLSPEVYLWINAFKRAPEPYTPDEAAWLTSVDPLFPFSLRPHASLGRACRTGHSVFSVDGAGEVQRCHFVSAVLGNIYRGDFEPSPRPLPCPATTCSCHIGYVHLEHLGLEACLGDGLLERIPDKFSEGMGLGGRPSKGKLEGSGLGSGAARDEKGGINASTL